MFIQTTWVFIYMAIHVTANLFMMNHLDFFLGINLFCPEYEKNDIVYLESIPLKILVSELSLLMD